MIQIFDDSFRELAAGTERVTRRLSPGLYTVRWQAYDLNVEEIVRLVPSGRPRVVRLQEPTDPAQRPRATRPLASIAEATKGRGAAIVVLELADDGVPAPELSKGVRLFNRDEVAMRSDREGVEGLREALTGSEPGGEGAWALRVYDVPPGAYRLRYRTASGDLVDQTVPALQGRRTLVFLRRAKAQAMVWKEDGFQVEDSWGVDPERVTILSVSYRSDLRPSRTALRLTRLLLTGLSAGAARLDANLFARVTQRGADPLWRLYAATHLWVATASPASASGAEAPSRKRDHARLCAVLKDLPDALPDVGVMRCSLMASETWSPPLRLEAPPMLAAIWTWAASRLEEHAFDLPSLRAAAKTPAPAGPWLAWMVTGAKFGTVAADQEGLPTLSRTMLLNQALDQVGELAAQAAQQPLVLLPEVSGVRLSPESRQLVQAVGEVGVEALRADPGALDVLARSLSISSNTALERLQLAADQASRPAVETGAAAQFGIRIAKPKGGATRTSRQPPALARPIEWRDDPQKGRFGGLARRDGFVLSASFDDEDPEWIEIRLAVTASASADLHDADRVTFYLHDTFKPDSYARAFRGRTAKLTVHAFGGFTVGVWLPRQQVELELDLADVPGAPRAIREW